MSPGQHAGLRHRGAGRHARRPRCPAMPASSSTTALPLMPSDSKSPFFSCSTTSWASVLSIAKNCDVFVAERRRVVDGDDLAVGRRPAGRPSCRAGCWRRARACSRSTPTACRRRLRLGDDAARHRELRIAEREPGGVHLLADGRVALLPRQRRAGPRRWRSGSAPGRCTPRRRRPRRCSSWWCRRRCRPRALPRR